MDRKISRALISVFHKDGLEPLVQQLFKLGVEILSTGGTQRAIEAMGLPVTSVESVTGAAEMLGGRVKTLHPLVFGGILSRRGHASDDVDVLEDLQGRRAHAGRRGVNLLSSGRDCDWPSSPALGLPLVGTVSENV